MIALAPLLLALAAADGGTAAQGGLEGRFDAPLYAHCPSAAPTQPMADGYRLVSPARAARLDCLLVTADERVKQLELELEPEPVPFFSTASQLFGWGLLVLGLLAGGWAGWALRGVLRL